jgi:thymidylate kinase
MTFAVFEGLDGSGKSTVAAAVAKHIGAQLIHFPNDDSASGKLIRSALRKQWSLVHTTLAPNLPNIRDAFAMVFQALQLANRMEQWAILSQAAAGEAPLVAARYWQSGLVFGSLDGLSRQWLIDIHKGLPQAAHNVLIDVSVGVALERQLGRNAPLEAYEGNIQRTARIRELYLELWQERGWPIVNGEQPIDDVIADALEVVACVS